jgi:hypothetical protein
MSVLAVVVDGKWVAAHDGQPLAHRKPDIVPVPTGDVDRIVSLLGQIVRMAQGLSPTEARRVRDFVQATQSMLTATTYLETTDQRLFERSLRDEVARR